MGMKDRYVIIDSIATTVIIKSLARNKTPHVLSINLCAKEDARSFSDPNSFIAKLNVHGFLLCLVEAPNIKRPHIFLPLQDHRRQTRRRQTQSVAPK